MKCKYLYIIASAAAVLLSGTVLWGQSYEKVIPRPQQISASKGVHHHKANELINVRLNRKVADEGYILRVTPKAVTIEASGSAGVFYAKQTLCQMSGRMFSDIETAEWTIDCCTIKDEPRFPYRGLMLDASRHFRSKEFILKHIDAMAAVKLNRLHMHLTDAEGWRLQIDRYPLLTSRAAWRQQQFCNDWRRSERHFSSEEDGFGGFYTKDDIREIVAYATARHVTVVPEIEIPGHSYEVCSVYPQVSCSGREYENTVLCPGKEATFEFMQNVLDEVMELFPSEYIHIGGDEANKKAWQTCPDCQKRIADEGLKDVNELQSYTIKRIERYLESHGRHIIGWDEILEGGLAPNATVMSWRGIDGGNKATELGHDAIMTPGKFCYIDAAQDKPDKEPAAYGVYLPLEKIYSYNPTDEIADPSHITGVQANLWGEYIVSDEYAEYMYWPRGLAIAEIGWTQPENKDGYDKFRTRALDLNAQMLDAGYHAFDLASEAGNRAEFHKMAEHLARGCKVIYNEGCKWSGGYPAAKEASLTDGILGGWSYRDDRWQGTTGNFDVTIDLGRAMDVSRVEAEFYRKQRDMNTPEYAEFLISDDGVNFTTVACVGKKPDGERNGSGRWRREPYSGPEGKASFRRIVIPQERGNEINFPKLIAEFDTVKTRYIRFRTERSNFWGYFFLDEIMVY